MPITTSFWQRRLFWRIKVWEAAAFAGLYLAMGLLYYTAIYLTVSQNQIDSIAINYLYKAVLTVPFWWLFFRKLSHWPFYQKALLHLPACALYVGVWLWLFYTTLDFIGMSRLQGAGIWWDVYIPVLVYFIQFGVFHTYAFWNETLRQKEKEKELLQMAHTAELNTLKAQIQPHFLFNTLNSISASMPASEEESRTMIAQLADVFRFAMNVTDKETIPLKSEMQFIQNFLALEQHRFGDRLTVQYDVDSRLNDFTLPPMLLQPLVENAIKHGIAKSLEGGSICIRIRQQGGKVAFEVSDTGKGINGATQEHLFSKGIGLENTRRRLLRLYNTPLHISNGEPTGCLVQFSLPLQTHPA